MLDNVLSKIVPFVRFKVEKYCTAGQPTNDNTAHAHCMLDTYGYKHALRTCSAFPLLQCCTIISSVLRHTYVVLTSMIPSTMPFFVQSFQIQ